MVPSSINFPTSLDTDANLFVVHDSLRVTLLEDYNPGDTVIQISGDTSTFPPTGYITITEQCNSDYDVRAISFYYGLVTTSTFEELQLLPGFIDTAKPKSLTNVTMNVMADHRNALKDALIAIEKFIGVQGTIDVRPLGNTLEGRINYLRSLVLRPRAWFSCDKHIGILPLTVTFTDGSFRGPTSWEWDFGDNTISNVSDIISTTEIVPLISNVLVDDLDGGTIQKTYTTPGNFSVTLTVTNEFGADTIVLPDIVSVRVDAPNDAIVSVTPGSDQTITVTDDSYLDLHLLPGIINTSVGAFVNMAVIDNGAQSNDPVVGYDWKLGDDLNHANAVTTQALFNIGGLYDIRLRETTQFGSYRTTILPEAINVIETENLFLLLYDNSLPATTRNITSYEFGLVSETFKTKNRSSVPVTKNTAFLDPSIPQYSQQVQEFMRNNGMAQRGSIFSGDNGTAIVYWSEGAGASAPDSAQTLRFMEYEGFNDVWRTSTSTQVAHTWNWVDLASPSALYIMLGEQTGLTNSPTNQNMLTLDFTSLTTSSFSFVSGNYANNADELMFNVGGGSAGDFSVYRSAWNGSNGYFLRNNGVSAFFRIQSFYRTEGILADPVQLIRKLTDMPGTAKVEGELVSMSQGLYFFNNSGEIVVYSPYTNTWAVGGPGVNSPLFQSLQDITVPTFSAATNTLLAVSDQSTRTYLSYDYSTAAFVKFVEADLTFVSLPSRPTGDQFVAGVF